MYRDTNPILDVEDEVWLWMGRQEGASTHKIKANAMKKLDKNGGKVYHVKMTYTLEGQK